jgi:hypothetical protein
MPLPAAVLKARDASRRRRERVARAEDRLRQIQTIETMQHMFQKKGPADKGLLAQKYASKWIKTLSPDKAKSAGNSSGSSREVKAEDTAAPVITRAATMHNLPTAANYNRRKSQGRLENMKRLRAMRRRRSAGIIKTGKLADEPPSPPAPPPPAPAPQRPAARKLLSHSRSMSTGIHFDHAMPLESILTNSNYKLEMLPHQHTLKCDRRERVCTIKGATERETIVLRTPVSRDASHSRVREIAWFTFLPSGGRSQHQQQVGTGAEYRLRREDVGHHITAVVTMESGARSRATAVGPVIPGPASIDSIAVEFSPGVDNCCVCKVDYWGGVEGDSTYRWIAVRSDGSRETLVEESVCSASQFGSLNPSVPSRDDPRFYFLKESDMGSKIKVSYRPIREDGWRGELKTSRAMHV